MSYCRGDVYAYATWGGYCIHTSSGENIFVETPEEFRDHLIRLNAPEYAINRIKREILEYKDQK